MITEKNRNLLLQLKEQLENQKNTDIIVSEKKDTKDVEDHLSIDLSKWSFPETLESNSRRALKPFVKSQSLLAVKIEQSNISVWYSKGNMCLEYIDVYTVDPKSPRLFYSMKLDHIWVSHGWVNGAMTRKNQKHGYRTSLYLPAMVYEYSDAHGNVKYGLRAPYYYDAALDLNQYQIML